MGAYLCIASNGVPPSISKRVILRVQFPPMLTIANQLEAAYIGQDVSLECHTEAFPSSINYWTNEKGDMIVSGERHETVLMDQGYTKYMMLKIHNVTNRDFGTYQCIAKNSLGETDGLIKLEGRSKLIYNVSLSYIVLYISFVIEILKLDQTWDISIDSATGLSLLKWLDAVFTLEIVFLIQKSVPQENRPKIFLPVGRINCPMG
ncbi:hypothetical protein AAG570_006175 [Ranatra chinensis]|uniref:Ig-like domain-containing protein n=1 Tax=Ranatra chinensis TaxID=642074 RepID=A0ABD0XXA1_9HEMI